MRPRTSFVTASIFLINSPRGWVLGDAVTLALYRALAVAFIVADTFVWIIMPNAVMPPIALASMLRLAMMIATIPSSVTIAGFPAMAANRYTGRTSRGARGRSWGRRS